MAAAVFCRLDRFGGISTMNPLGGGVSGRRELEMQIAVILGQLDLPHQPCEREELRPRK
jgi:hypothetical protein